MLLQSYFLQCKSGAEEPSEQPARNGLRHFIPFQLKKTMKLLHRKMSDDIFQQLELSIVFSRLGHRQFLLEMCASPP